MSLVSILLYVGLDCGSQEHCAQLLTPDGEELEQRVVGHSPEGFQALVAWLLERARGDAARIAVALESPRGPLVETLLDRGFLVFAINPKQLDRFRDRHGAAGAKDDSRDALVLADSLRTDRRHFRRVEPEQNEIVMLREYHRMRYQLKTEEVRLVNRIRDRLQGYYPQVLELAGQITDPLLQAVLRRWPTPDKAARCTLQGVKTLLKGHRIRRLSAEQIHAHLRSAEFCGSEARGRVEAEFVLLELRQLALLREQRAALEASAAEVRETLAAREQEENPDAGDVRILESLPGLGPVLLNALLAEGWQGLRTRDLTYLRTHGGIAPVTRQSGKRRLVVMRRACNGYLRDALHQWGLTALSCDLRSRHHYKSLRERGHSHGRALRGVVDMLLRLAIGMLRNRTLYDPERWLSNTAA